MFTSLINKFKRHRIIKKLIYGDIHFTTIKDVSLVIEAINFIKNCTSWHPAYFSRLVRQIRSTLEINEQLQEFIVYNGYQYGVIQFSDRMQFIICDEFPQNMVDIANPNEATTIKLIIRMMFFIKHERLTILNVVGQTPHKIIELLHIDCLSNDELRELFLKRLYGSLNDDELDEILLIYKLAS